MIIYKITNIQNNKVYIGQTKETLQQRFSRHMGYQSVEHDSKFYRAVRKYGRNNFTIEQIDEAFTQDELDEKEVYWIRYYNSVNNGYNSNDHKGRVGGDTLSDHPNLSEIKRKLSDSKMGAKNPMAKGVIAKNIITGEMFQFGSFCECARILGFSNHICISKRVSGEIKTPYKNKWLFERID